MCKGFNIKMVGEEIRRNRRNSLEKNSEFHEMKTFEYFLFLFCLLKNSKVEEKQKMYLACGSLVAYSENEKSLKANENYCLNI